jgi:hypothetical protein
MTVRAERIDLSRMSWFVFSLIVTTGIFPITIYIVWEYSNFIDLVYMILIALSLPTINGIIWMIYLLVRRKQIRNEQEKNPERVMNYEKSLVDFRQQLKNYKSKRTKIEVLKICEILVFKGDISNENCVISKVAFTQDDVVLSCPFCRKKFKRQYLVEWLEKRDICPVCRVKIIVR